MVGDECAGRHGKGGECNGLRISGEEASRESNLGIGLRSRKRMARAWLDTGHTGPPLKVLVPGCFEVDVIGVDTARAIDCPFTSAAMAGPPPAYLPPRMLRALLVSPTGLIALHVSWREWPGCLGLAGPSLLAHTCGRRRWIVVSKWLRAQTGYPLRSFSDGD